MGLKMKQMKTARSYNMSDGKMVVRAGVVGSLYEEDQGEYTKYSSTLFHSEYLTVFQGKINMVYTKLSDREIKKNLAIRTQKVDDTIDELSVAHAGIMIFAEIAFPDNEMLLKQMGKGELRSIKKSHNSAQFNMSRISIIFEREKEALVEAGCSPERIEEFKSLCAKMVTVHQDQENYKITRNSLTKQRIVHLNEIYATMVQLHEVANVIWADDKEYAKRYDLPQNSPNGSDEDILNDEEVEAEIEAMTHMEPSSEEDVEV